MFPRPLDHSRLRDLFGARSRSALVFVCLLWLLGFSLREPDAALAQSPPVTPAGQTSSDQPAVTLEPNQPLEQEISGGQKRRYQISLAEGQFVRITIKQSGVNLGVVLHLANGDSVQINEPFGNQPELTFSWVAEQAGNYETAIYTNARAPAGHYQIEITEFRVATERDRQLYRANKFFAQFVVLNQATRYLEAREVLAQALEIRERVLGKDDRLVAATLGFLADSYQSTGEYAKAEPIKLRALNIVEKIKGPDHPDVAFALTELGGLYREMGDDLKAEEVDLRALDIYERAQLSDSPEVGSVLGALGSVYYDRGDFAGAAKYYERSKAVWEKLLGPDHFHMAPSYAFLGRVAYGAGDFVKAEAMLQRALKLAESGLGPEHLRLTPYLNNLALVYLATGKYDEAEALYRRALANHVKMQAMDYPEVQETLWGLGRLYAAKGKMNEAVDFQTRATEAEERNTKLNLAVGSEREKLVFAANLYSRMSWNISLHVNLIPNDPAARDLAFTSILQRKGRVQDAVSAGLVALRSRFAPEDRELLDQLNEVTEQVARRVLGRVSFLAPAAPSPTIKDLEERQEKLEEEVSRRSAGYFQQPPSPTIASVQSAVPRDAALVEFAVYLPFDPKAPDNRSLGEPRYVAYVLRSQGAVQWRDLGPARTIDEGVTAWRKALGDPKRKDVGRLARAVDELVMRPVRALGGDATHLLISPDGELNLIPFGALVDEQNRYLIQRYAFTFLTSGRDLLRMQVTAPSKDGPLVIANPSFGEPAAEQVAKVDRANAEPNHAGRRSLTSAGDLSQLYFAPLEGTVREADSIRGLFPDAKVLIGPAATKAALEKVAAPSILHFATHGFFIVEPGEGADPGPGSNSRVENPLLRSGLALADANLRGRESNGILTALEASGLNLWGTKLVVLSACDTGLGEIHNGEGVYGLRRAFVLAGAESLVMSLWPVSDFTTRTLMANYYLNLKQGMGRGAALRQVQLDMLKHDPHLHPFYWANFIQSGEWANLSGKR